MEIEIILVCVGIYLMGMSIFITNCISYNKGQKDAQEGKIKYKKFTSENGKDTTWIRID
jgi:hypothetical protein